MIQRFKNFEREFSVSKAAFIVGFFTLLSKLVGLVRDPLLAGRIGVGNTLDVYYTAFRVPDFIFNLLILGTLSAAVIPVFTEWLNKDKEKAFKIASSVLNISILGMILVCLILFALAEPLAKILAPGFSGEKLAQTTQLMRLFLLSPIIFTISNFFTSVLSSYKKFLILSVAPILYNVGIICGLFFLYPTYGLFGLGLGVIFGALMHLAIQVPAALAEGFEWSMVFDFKNTAVKKIGKLFLPRIIGMDISQISLIIGTTVGSILATGSVTIFNLANNLQAAPLGVFALSVAAASFPLLSEQYSKKNDEGFINTLAKNIMLVLFFIIPITILMLTFRAYIVRIIYGHGKFDWNNTIAMFTTFGILSFSLIGQSLSPLFTRSFYARHNTKIPVLVNVFSIVLDAVLAYYLGKTFKLPGIAWGFVIACTFDAAVMFLFLRHFLRSENISLINFDKIISSFLTRLLGASIIMGLSAHGALYVMDKLISNKTTVGIMVQTGVSVGVGLLAFLLCAYALEIEQAQVAVRYIKRFLGVR